MPAPAAAPAVIIDDDDDEFDWEAAVQEIDVACLKTGQSASFSSLQSPRPIYAPPARAEKRGIGNESCGQLNGSHKNIRQSTLDQFINTVPEPNLNGNSYNGKELEVEAKIDADVEGCCVHIDPEAAKTWIYPENVPIREYQRTISKTALFANTMVALPTGLGKTLIAAVVMYNYFRWFPEGKIVFAAPSRPLVMQQIEACHNIVGIPQEWTIDMTGKTSPAKRACLWKEKRVFFVTPQVFEKDIQSGTCLVQNLVCLVIDEAHRATGNYSYCVAVRELMSVPVKLRILALTATPGSKQQAIQQVIDNLQISMLEYRMESDPDVAPYVHNRKLDLFEVPMGKDAVNVNNLLLDVMRPIAARLISMGLLPNRDFQTLSPCDLLNSRERFRQAPPLNLHGKKSVDIEGWLSVLISLYHLRKLLSSHGIRPAYEMLEEKLKQGSFARQMNKHEGFHRMKGLMRRSMLNGAPSPKLTKLIEVLVDHFKKNSPESSRVIIFSNFRGSVRDIMDALSNIGNFVKPTEFIGQSSGKTLKGQTQKVQQDVLEKFRKGGYNVIVATSIGEEGLDIMEVDLVICFDANISPLRMIQRMGRTGRKHDGRVVIIVCEGSEMKGYMRKQATSKSVKKHMRNGGINSFNFHSSPRMVPHIYRPEQMCLEIPIPEFVPRGKKVKDDSDPLLFEEKLTDAEALTLARYFPNKENTWKPSLIAYPQFQAFPSGVQIVKHSSRTVMLIDAMQNLQGPACTWNNPSYDFEYQNYPNQGAVVPGIENANNIEEEHMEVSNAEMVCVPNSSDKAFTTKPAFGISSFKELCDEPASTVKVLDSMAPPDTSENKQDNQVSNVTSPCRHLFLFSSEVASVDSTGRVSVASVPILDISIARNCILPDCSRQVAAADSEPVSGNVNELPVEILVLASRGSPEEEDRCGTFEALHRSRPPTPEIKPISLVTSPWSLHDELNTVMIHSSPEFLVLNDDEEEHDLSPRLTNFVVCGCVPESPIQGSLGGSKKDNEITGLGSCALPVPRIEEDAKVTVMSSPFTPVLKAASINSESTCEVIEEYRTPLGNITNTSCSKDWYMSSEQNSVGSKTSTKLKRLCKIGDTKCCNGMKESPDKFTSMDYKAPAGRNFDIDARDLIEDEAEVCSDVEVSADEEDHHYEDTFEDSFIDDRIDSTMATQPHDSKVDMMAIYRRSLLSQSPIRRQKNRSSSVTPDSLVSATSLDSCSVTGNFLHPPQGSKSNNFTENYIRRKSVCLKLEKIAEEAMPSTSRSRKRKYSCGELQVPVINLENEFSCHQNERENDPNGNVYMDDEFYESLDFDALEAQAMKLLGEKVGSAGRKECASKPVQPRVDDLGLPSFDLGI